MPKQKNRPTLEAEWEFWIDGDEDEDDEDVQFIVGADPKRKWEGASPWTWGTVAERVPRKEIAALISAAPDMRDALLSLQNPEGCINGCGKRAGTHAECFPECKAVQVALAKAKGAKPDTRPCCGQPADGCYCAESNDGDAP
jgi:hypothetical protein